VQQHQRFSGILGLHDALLLCLVWLPVSYDVVVHVLCLIGCGRMPSGFREPWTVIHNCKALNWG
jgi:hypothetical protein